MRRKPVSSAAISSVGYDSKSKTLEVEFSSGMVYDYVEVPPKIYESLLAAESIGRFVSKRIRDRYPFVRVDEGSVLSPQDQQPEEKRASEQRR